MDTLENNKRDKAFNFTYMEIIHNNFIGDSNFKRNYNYSFFRKRCLDIYNKPTESTSFFVHRIVTSTLSWLLFAGNKQELPDVIKRNELKLIELEKQYEINQNNTFLQSEIDRVKKHINNLPKQTEEYNQIYHYICNELLPKLLIEYSDEKG